MIDIYRHKAIVSEVPKILKYLDPETKAFLNKVVSDSREILNTYEWDNNTIIQATQKEVGGFYSGTKRVLRGYYGLNKDWTITLSDTVEEWQWEMFDAIESMVFSTDVFNAKILLNRRVNHDQLKPLERVLNESIKLELIKQFENKHKKLITQKPTQ